MGPFFNMGLQWTRGAGADQLDDGERRDAGRQDKMCSKAVDLAPS